MVLEIKVEQPCLVAEKNGLKCIISCGDSRAETCNNLSFLKENVDKSENSDDELNKIIFHVIN